MCGVAGIRQLDGAQVDAQLLRTMGEALRHRGPDDEGFWSSGDVGFAHRRLSIIDVELSTQPMTSASGDVTITFNGEILNYRELRRDLDYPFVTGGDTETLLALYERYGMAMLERLRGQFAFGLHDARTDELWLARDRIGVLPLYLYRDGRRLAFASEIKALLPAIPGGAILDRGSLSTFLAHRSVPAPATLFEGVSKLPPGVAVRVSRDGSVDHQRYWQIPSPTSGRVRASHAVARVDGALRDAVEEALVADVPVGAYLSGGVDSSLISALVARVHGPGLDTFSAGFGDARVDETDHARRVSTLLGTRHHEVLVTGEDFASDWERLTWHRDAPLSEPADVAVYRLARLASGHVKVVLSGEGSDELFGGYPKYRLARASTLALGVPMPLRAGASSIIERAAPGARRLRIGARALRASDRDEMLRAWFAPFTEEERRALVGPDGRPAPTQHVPGVDGDPLRRMLAHDVSVWLPDNLLERGDRMTMAASIEMRPPFLDRRVVELAFALPSRVKLRGGTTKWVVKEVARRYLPADIVDRKKAGFRVPLDSWFRSGLRDQVHSLLLASDARVPEFLDRDAVAGLVTRHESGQTDESIRIWTLLGLEIWARAFLGSGDGVPACGVS
jgi:asparagine synthase (glutamine-hydrolysing)